MFCKQSKTKEKLKSNLKKMGGCKLQVASVQPQGTRCREQGTGSREQGTGKILLQELPTAICRLLTFYFCPLPFAFSLTNRRLATRNF